MPFKKFNATRLNVIYNKCGFPSLASKVSAAEQAVKTGGAPNSLCEMVGLMFTQTVLAKRAATKAKNEEKEEEAKETSEEKTDDNDDPDDPDETEPDTIDTEPDDVNNGDDVDDGFSDDFPEEPIE